MLDQRNAGGASLVELLISMALGFASLTAMSSLVGHGMALNNSLMEKSRLDEELHAVMAIIEQDISRLGFVAAAEEMVTTPEVFVHPFSDSLRLSEYGLEDKNSCITFAYDRDKDGALEKTGVNEKFGFRLRDKAVELRVDGHQCADGYWQDLTDTKVVQITQLLFRIEKLQHLQVAQVRIEMVLQAKLVKFPEHSRHISTQFVVNNYD
ncbi:prepilin peptidase dependent protein B [Paraglaciecola aquimarina]|uniref:Prepilin peptidase dependent protein B n=1 Tax=Paraglaciecola aquimarina TaxID=1235557 RepID=A0ABU3T1D0_9ALTE|nr:prepilin peptidase dependent protein B [Paraglaciecola aquimarina]MDU0356080.1 prepilin peptidase dependent protein B [Paraglaciecola aquimarina]